MALTEKRVWVLRGDDVPHLYDLVFAHTPGGAAATQPTQWSGQQGYFYPGGADRGVAWVEFPTPRGFAELRGRRRNHTNRTLRLEIWGGPELAELRLLYIMDVPAGTAEEAFVFDMSKPPLEIPALMAGPIISPMLFPYTLPAPPQPMLVTPILCGGSSDVGGVIFGATLCNGVPTRRLVEILDGESHRLVGSSQSGADGAYKVDGLTAGKEYVVVSYPIDGAQNAVIYDRVKAVPRPV
nr:MAG TPA: hypothetical protein [Caudoviricetes sp.]